MPIRTILGALTWGYSLDRTSRLPGEGEKGGARPCDWGPAGLLTMPLTCRYAAVADLLRRHVVVTMPFAVSVQGLSSLGCCDTHHPAVL